MRTSTHLPTARRRAVIAITAMFVQALVVLAGPIPTASTADVTHGGLVPQQPRVAPWRLIVTKTPEGLRSASGTSGAA